MKNTMSVVLIVLIALALSAPASAQALFPEAEEVLNPEGRSKIKPSTFNFLKVTNNARVAGMGDAFTAVSDGIDGMIWNPAGLTKVNKLGYAFGYTQWLVESSFVTGSLAYNTGQWGVLGVSFVNFTLPDIPETTTMEPDGTGAMVNSGDLAVGLVYAYQLTDKLSAAASLRFVQSALGPETLSAVSVNVSTLMYTGFSKPAHWHEHEKPGRRAGNCERKIGNAPGIPHRDSHGIVRQPRRSRISDRLV